jgi:hypothetical protein
MKTVSLTEQIDKLVRDHLAQIQLQATAAVERAFASATKVPDTRTRSSRRSPGKRRDPAFVSELADRLQACVVAKPGESMTVYATQLGASVRELHRPMTMLKRAGRLRTTGARNYTRYFPLPGT